MRDDERHAIAFGSIKIALALTTSPGPVEAQRVLLDEESMECGAGRIMLEEPCVGALEQTLAQPTRTRLVVTDVE